MSPVPEDEKNRDDAEKSENNIENLEVPQYTLNIGTSSDSEDDDGGNGGYYQLLPQEPDGQTIPYPVVDDEDEDDPDEFPTPTIENPPGEFTDFSNTASSADIPDAESSIPSDTSSYMQVPKCRTGETEDRLDLWNAPNEGKVKMDPDQADQIKKALSGFTLPPPPWARVVPEQQWKTNLISRLPGQPIQQDNPWQGPRDSSNKNCDKSDTDATPSGWANFSDSQ